MEGVDVLALYDDSGGSDCDILLTVKTGGMKVGVTLTQRAARDLLNQLRGLVFRKHTVPLPQGSADQLREALNEALDEVIQVV